MTLIERGQTFGFVMIKNFFHIFSLSSAAGYVVLLDSALVVSTLVDPRTVELCHRDTVTVKESIP